jgi:N-acetylglucosamine malate deacetylase 2
LQRFIPDSGGGELAVELCPDQRRHKQAMLDAHATQRETLLQFPDEVERFRPAPRYDFGTLPNNGRLLYELYGWGMTGARWQALARAALAELAAEGTA